MCRPREIIQAPNMAIKERTSMERDRRQLSCICYKLRDTKYNMDTLFISTPPMRQCFNSYATKLTKSNATPNTITRHCLFRRYQRDTVFNSYATKLIKSNATPNTNMRHCLFRRRQRDTIFNLFATKLTKSNATPNTNL